MNCADATPWGVQRREYDPGGLSYSEDFLLFEMQGKTCCFDIQNDLPSRAGRQFVQQNVRSLVTRSHTSHAD